MNIGHWPLLLLFYPTGPFLGVWNEKEVFHLCLSSNSLCHPTCGPLIAVGQAFLLTSDV